MSIINSITDAIIALITVGAGFRCMYIVFQMIYDPDNKDTYVKQLRNTIIAFVLGISTLSIKTLIESYYG